ncbi:MAG: hypothetical protein ACRDVE_14030, partial [Actinocrinis sp.]
LDEGTDPAIVANWIREVETGRLAIQIQARLRTATRRTAKTADKIKIYTRLGPRMTHDINANVVNVTAQPRARINAPLDDYVRKYGVRGGIIPVGTESLPWPAACVDGFSALPCMSGGGGPADDFAGAQLQEHCEIHPALAGGERG